MNTIAEHAWGLTFSKHFGSIYFYRFWEQILSYADMCPNAFQTLVHTLYCEVRILYKVFLFINEY